MDPIHWTCPFCDRDTTITEDRVHQGDSHLTIRNAEGNKYFSYAFIVCPNKDCARFTLKASLWDSEWRRDLGQHRKTELIESWSLVPPSKAKPLPDYIPKAIVDDYHEACLVIALSPKASATLARRCLQGMIRDFWNVQRDTLFHEIEAIKDRVEPETWMAIHSVRELGNIGAHMQKDINLLIDVDASEAESLVSLIETLIEQWYIARHDRKQRMEAVVRIAQEKSEAQNHMR